MTKFNFHMGVDARCYGNVPVTADNIEQAVATLTADYIGENIEPGETTWDGLNGLTIIDVSDEGGTAFPDYEQHDLASPYDAPPTIPTDLLVLLKRVRDLMANDLTTHIFNAENGEEPDEHDPHVVAIADIDAVLAGEPAPAALAAILAAIDSEIVAADRGIAEMRTLHENPEDPDGPAEDDEAYTIEECLQDQKAALERVKMVVLNGAPAATDPTRDEYLSRFPEDQRETADRAYQDGYVDGIADASDLGQLAVVIEGGLATNIIADGGLIGLPVTIIDYDTENADPTDELINVVQEDGATREALVLHSTVMKATITLPTEGGAV